MTSAVAELPGRRSSEARASAIVAVAAAGFLATAITAWGCASSTILVDPAQTAVWRSSFVAAYVAVGAYTWWRRPESPLGRLVAGVGLFYSLATLNASAAPLAHTLGMVVWVAVIVYQVYVYLSFPRGRLESQLERGFVAAVVVATGTVWTLMLAMSPSLPIGAVFNDCGTHCPSNALQITNGGSDIARAFSDAFNIVATVSLIGLAMLIFAKARSSAYASRRAMAPLAIVFTANIVEFVAFLFIGTDYPGTRGAFKFADGVVTLAVPAALLVGQLRARAFATMSLGELVLRSSSAPPAPFEVEKMIGNALGDRTLELALWDVETGTFVDVRGHAVRLPPSSAPRGVTRLMRDGWPVAALIHDPALEVDPDIAEGLAATSLMLLENWRLVEELRSSRVRLVKAGERERQRLERDLHDGTQQSLIAIAMRLELALETSDPSELSRQLSAIQREAESALGELRELAHGIYPPVLHDFGLGAALHALATRCPLPVQITDNGVGRSTEAIEAALYFCAREAIQNAIKHAGASATVSVMLVAAQDSIEMTISDDGPGMARGGAHAGMGVIDMRDRVEAVGGHLELGSATVRGTTVHAVVPVDASRARAAH